MAAEQDAGGALPSALEKLFRPLTSGVRQLVTSPDSRSLTAYAGVEREAENDATHWRKEELESASRPSDKIIRTPEETIQAILTRNGGEMKQAEIADLMEYSESTVSRKLSKMESSGAIKRFQIGRGKVVFLPDAVPESFDSPLH